MSAAVPAPTSTAMTPLAAGLRLFAAFTLLGLLFSFQMALAYGVRGSRLNIGEALRWGLPPWYLWGLLSPAIFAIARRSPFAPHRRAGSLLRHAVAGLVLSVLHGCAYTTWCHALAPIPGVGGTWSAMFWFHTVGGLSWKLFEYCSLAGGWYVFDASRRSRADALRAARLEAQLLEARLTALRMQLQPHFLFNTLNSIAALVPEDPARAEAMIVRLSELLRQLLATGSQPVIALRDELEMARRYLALQQMRFGDRLRASVTAAPDALDVPVPTMILQPLVENAVRHGVDVPHGLPPVTIAITARRAGDAVELEVADSGPGLRARATGVGLANTRERLEQHYGSGSRLSLANADGGGAVARMLIPVPS